MTTRDRLRDQKYFEKYIQETIDLNTKSEKRLSKGETKEDRIPWVEFNIFTSRLEALISSYSLGNDKTALKNKLISLISLMEKYWHSKITKVKDQEKGKTILLDQYTLSNYEIMLQVISLAYLLDIPDNDFQRIVSIIDRDNISDDFLEFIIKARFPYREHKREEQYDKKLSYILKIYKKLREAIQIDDKSKASKLVKSYLEKNYYHKNLNAYNYHNSRFDIYYGYWSFESAVITKILSLDDFDFAGNTYYPIDLVDD